MYDGILLDKIKDILKNRNMKNELVIKEELAKILNCSIDKIGLDSAHL